MRKALLPCLTLFVLGVGGCGSSATGPSASPDTAGSTSAASTDGASSDPVAVGEALAVTDDYFSAYKAGDLGAMMELFASDIELSNAFGPVGLDQWEHLWTWKLAEGTVLTPPECTAAPSPASAEVTVACTYGHHEYLARIVDAPSVPHALTMTVADDGIRALSDKFGQPDFLLVGNPFEQWMREHHPDAEEAISFGEWGTAEQAQQAGGARAQYAELWAAYLDDHGCSFRDYSCS